MNNSKRKIVAVLAGIVVAGAGAASAATLGGLNTAKLGADETVVVSGDSNGVDIAYVTAFNAASGEYKVTGVTLSGMDAGLINEKADITLTNGSTALGHASGTVSGATQTFTLDAPASAAAITDAAVVISG
jgi:hypothetical protein